MRTRLVNMLAVLVLVAVTIAIVAGIIIYNANLRASVTPSAPTQPVAAPHAMAPPLYLGLDAIRHWDKLSYLEVGDRVAGMTTADPAGSNRDSLHVMRVLSDGERVLFDQTGPGVVSFMRMQESYGGPWQLYLDGSYITTTQASALGQITPTLAPAASFPYPLSYSITQSQGSSIVGTSIPFQQAMMWTAAAHNGNFYSIYRKLPYGYPISTWTGREPISDVVGLLRQAGSDIAPSNIISASGSITLPASLTTTLTSISGGYQLRAIKFHVPYAEKVRFANSRLLIYWDGESTPSVDAPIKFLIGDGAGVYQPSNRPLVGGWLAGAGGDGSSYMDFNLYWPMPFTTNAQIAIASASTSDLSNIGWSVRYEPFPDPPGWWGYFHVAYTSVAAPIAGQDMTFLDVSGSGKVVGTVVNFSHVGNTLEGDPHFYIDDSQTPQLQVTGTEEWGTGGNYWNVGNQTSLPTGGLPSSENNPPGEDVDGAALYRFLAADSIPFNRHLVLRWEHGGQDEATLPYRAAVLWYGNRTRTALLSDQLSLGDANSRLAHNYQSPASSSYSLTAAYDYAVHSPVITDTGIGMSAVCSFTLALDPANVGAFLRRRLDYGVANQRANVYIDGQFAGTWYTPGSFNGVDVDGNLRRWRDEEFPLPPAMTGGKSAVTVRIQFVPTTDPPNSSWTEFQYQMYSLVMPPNSEPLTPTPTDVPSTPAATATITSTPLPTASPTATITPTITPTPTVTPTDCANPFGDIGGSVFYVAIHRLYCGGVVNGIDSSHFGPTSTSTRGQFAKLVALGFALPTYTPSSPDFTDVLPSYFAYAFIEAGYHAGILSGYSAAQCAAAAAQFPCYLPNQPITRAELTKLVTLAAGYALVTPVGGGQTYTDVPASHFAYLYIETAHYKGLIAGYPDGSFHPNANIRRDEMCQIVYKGTITP